MPSNKPKSKRVWLNIYNASDTKENIDYAFARSTGKSILVPEDFDWKDASAVYELTKNALQKYFYDRHMLGSKAIIIVNNSKVGILYTTKNFLGGDIIDVCYVNIKVNIIISQKTS